MMWETTRETVIKDLAKAPGLPEQKAREAYLRNVDEIYQSDAYHSLSIEGYSVSAALIEKVGPGGWNPDRNECGCAGNLDVLLKTECYALDGGVKQRVSHPGPPFNPVLRLMQN